MTIERVITVCFQHIESTMTERRATVSRKTTRASLKAVCLLGGAFCLGARKNEADFAAAGLLF